MTTYTAATITTVTKTICTSSSSHRSPKSSPKLACGQNFSSISEKYRESKLEVFNSIRSASESESDDSFIVFQEAGSTATEYAYNFTRMRQVSECSSDDFIIFESGKTDTHFSYDTSTTTGSNDTELSSDDDDETDTECSSTHKKRQNGAQSINVELRKKKKRVKFNLCPIVHEIRAWKFAYQQARKGHWHQIGWDRERFQKRINDLGEIVTPILIADHRQKIYAERFCENFFTLST